MLRSRLRAEGGFSLVEILVVILIIGILAAIALPAFLNQRSKAQDADAKTSATTAAKAMAVWQTEHDSYSGAAPSDLVADRARARPGSRPRRDVAARARTPSRSIRWPAARSRWSAGWTACVVRGCTQPGVGACAAIADAEGNRW